MPLRRLTRREYVVNLIAVVALWPVYRRREWADRPSLDAFALRRATGMAVHAARATPLYRDLYETADVDPRTVASWADFARLPLVDKSALSGGYPSRSMAEGSELEKCLLSTSSGSSGQLMTIPHRADRFWPYLLSGQRMLRWATGGRYPFWWRQAYVYTSEYPLLRVPGFYPLTYISTGIDPELIIDALERLRPHIVHTYPTVLRDLLAVAPDRMRALGLKGVSVGSELSSRAERRDWEKTLGAPVRDEYSSEELGRIASECPKGRYHLHEDMVKIEIVDADGRPTDELGEVVGTELHNRTMPFVRYRQGDLARISDERCPCGRQTRLLADLVGRQNEGFLLQGGRHLPAGLLLDVSYRAILGLGEGIVAAYRFVQRSNAQAVFEIVPGPNWTANDAATIERSLSGELSEQIRVRVAIVDGIERSGGGKRSTITREF
jgi:phenylacetate-CoA ligase